ncbi:unnamed protein product [Adineta ricciae]|uniref:G-protein coupled receptors family 1 profile domain-containing protein n=1 Tax=Adineta ricciae TaxID=249248 RepID=A0A814PD16_ADIRI|nr:unnamed protein product [Adineta ricciae]CAF1106128.1 unnamed protein product [Adineta ricciae]
METKIQSIRPIHRIKFFMFLSLQIPSSILSLLIFIFFLKNPNHLRKLQNQALLVLFLINFIQLSVNMPMVIHFLRFSRIIPSTGSYCRLWMFAESTLDASNAITVAVMSIQRHTLIFHPTILRALTKRCVYYYFPLLLSTVYPLTFYLATVVFYPCDPSQWNFTLNMCGDSTCYLSDNPILATFDWIVNTGLPIFTIILANLALMIRVVKQKARRQQALPWAKQRRMTIQLLSIASLYLATWIPSITTGLMQQINASEYIYEFQEDYISDLTYFICLLLPAMSLGLLPDFTKWIWKHFRRLQRPTNVVGTTVL